MSTQSVREVRLDNGFSAFLLERHNLPVVASTMWYRVGSRDERSGESGLSHFIEHMMFKGTVRYRKGEIDLLTSKMGGSNNAFTDYDNTCYHFSLPAERWQTALDIEASRMRGCLFEPSEFEAEKSVVLEELSMGNDDPWTRLFHHVEGLAFDRHPYHRPIIGWQEELEALSVDQMREYYRRHYGTNRAFLVAVGAFDGARIEDQVRRLFGDKPRASVRAPVIAEPAVDGERRGVIHAPGNLARIAFASHTCRIGERDDFVLDVIAQIFGQGKSSRLSRRLTIDEQLASYVGVHNDVRLDPGLFWIYAEMLPGVDAAKGEAAVRGELKRLLEDGVTKDELDRALTQIRSSFLFEDESVLGTALKLGRFEASAERGYRLVDDVEQTYASITADDVQATLAKYFGGDGFTAVWSLPESKRAKGGFAGAVSPSKLRPKPGKSEAASGKRKKKPAKKPAKKKRAKQPAPESVKTKPKLAGSKARSKPKVKTVEDARERKKPRPSKVRLDKRRGS